MTVLVKRLLTRLIRKESGASLIEVVIALALLAIIGVAFLSALTGSSKARLVADEHASADTLARSQMENIMQQAYANSYDPIPIPSEYAGYSAEIMVDTMRNGNIQKITLTISHCNKEIKTLESYKVSP